MNWQQFVYVIYSIIGAAIVIAKTGSTKVGLYTPANVAGTVTLQALLVWLVLSI